MALGPTLQLFFSSCSVGRCFARRPTKLQSCHPSRLLELPGTTLAARQPPNPPGGRRKKTETRRGRSCCSLDPCCICANPGMRCHKQKDFSHFLVLRQASKAAQLDLPLHLQPILALDQTFQLTSQLVLTGLPHRESLRWCHLVRRVLALHRHAGLSLAVCVAALFRQHAFEQVQCIWHLDPTRLEHTV